ncbi:hypothetical protein ES705_08046 [subsurface metagenome]
MLTMDINLIRWMFGGLPVWVKEQKIVQKILDISESALKVLA